MHLTIRTFWAPKAGNRQNEYEDAFWPYRTWAVTSSSPAHFAVADGATESAFARLWARHLVQLYCCSQLWGAGRSSAFDLSHFQERVQHRAREWSSRVFSHPLPWFAVEKAQRGAFASLLGLTLEAHTTGDSHTGDWHALALGDSCLFQIHGDESWQSWPIVRSEGFGYHPNLLSTNPDRNEPLWPKIDEYTVHGVWRSRDRFLLMTDALAHWFLRVHEEGGMPWQELRAASNTRSDFSVWLENVRASGAMRNDDVTLVIVEVEDE